MVRHAFHAALFLFQVYFDTKNRCGGNNFK